jgi:acyl carrier protein
MLFRMPDELADRITRLISDTLRNGVPVGPSTSRRTEPAWDSLRHVEILLGVESVFDIRFEERELAELDSVAALTEAVRRHLGP